MNFLRVVGNLPNDPSKGWTVDFTWDLMVRLKMNPTNTSLETLFNYIGQHKMGYRIAMNCGPRGYTGSYWGCALDNGMMPFGAQGNNDASERFDEPVGLASAAGVAGGYKNNLTSYGQGVEFFDYAFPTDHAQSWANQAAAAKFALILDAHPQYNIWDARQHMRQSATFWSAGWTETNGYGRADEKAIVTKLLPGPPVDFTVTKSRDRHHVNFSWRNALQTDFAATVIARKDGRTIYDGAGTNFLWTSDVDGQETFIYWSRNQAGEKSRIESFQRRTIAELNCRLQQSCLVLGAPTSDQSLNQTLCDRFQEVATNWVCDIVYRPGNPFYDRAGPFPRGAVVAVLSEVPSMVDYAISNRYRMIIAPATSAESDLFKFKKDWDRATDAGILVVLPHNASLSRSRKPQARRLSPPMLFSAITVGMGSTSNLLSFGPGLEFFDAPDARSASSAVSQTDAAAVLAGKLARILDANPTYNIWDARQHLRQSSSLYPTGWVEDGGYGRPPQQSARIEQLDFAPPLEIRAQKSDDGKSVRFSWRNFLKSDFAETVIKKKDGGSLYHGTDTSSVWSSDVDGEETFEFFTQDKFGKHSRPESYTLVRVSGLSKASK
jgi:hypothetical protein